MQGIESIYLIALGQIDYSYSILHIQTWSSRSEPVYCKFMTEIPSWMQCQVVEAIIAPTEYVSAVTVIPYGRFLTKKNCDAVNQDKHYS